MKLLKLIPAAAVALTAFTTFEAKAFKICLYNNAGFDTKLRVTTPGPAYSPSKKTDKFPAGQTECLKMGDVPIPEGGDYDVYYLIPDAYEDSIFVCAEDKNYSSSDVGKTKTYTVSGTLSKSECEL